MCSTQNATEKKIIKLNKWIQVKTCDSNCKFCCSSSRSILNHRRSINNREFIVGVWGRCVDLRHNRRKIGRAGRNYAGTGPLCALFHGIYTNINPALVIFGPGPVAHIPAPLDVIKTQWTCHRSWFHRDTYCMISLGKLLH